MTEQTEPLVVLVTGAAGQIAYSLYPHLLNGAVFGSRPISLRLLDLDIPAVQEGVLPGVKMELEDLSYPSLAGCVTTADPEVAFKDIDVAIFLGAFPRKAGMERKDLLEKNVAIFSAQGKLMELHAKKTCKSLVVGNPANTNCKTLAENAPSIPKENFHALTRLDHNRAKGQLAIKAGVSPAAVKNVVIWGNHSSTQYPDTSFATVDGAAAKDKVDVAWMQNTEEGGFIPMIQKRGAAVIAARKLSSAASAAKAIGDHLHDWLQGTEEMVSMAVPADGSYGIAEGIVYSFPCTCKDVNYTIVKGLEISEFSRGMMDATDKELREEATMAAEIIAAAATEAAAAK